MPGGAQPGGRATFSPLPLLLPKGVTGVAESLLKQKSFHLAAFQDQLLPGVVAQEQVQAVDPWGLSFFNINTPEDLVLANTLYNE